MMEKSSAEDTIYAGPKKMIREVDSIGELSRDFSRIDGRNPSFFDGPEGEKMLKSHSRLNGMAGMIGNQIGVSRPVLSEDGDIFLSKELLKRQIRESEDEIIVMKKLYREKLEKRVAFPKPGSDL